jgi:two-component system cell cycle response regulator
VTDPKLHILVVEHPDSHSVEETLRSAGWDAHGFRRAESVTDALSSLRRDSFDLVLLDLALPDAHGLATVTRTREAAGELPVIVFTDELDEPMAHAAVEIGAQDFLVKGRDGAAELMRSIRYSISRLKSAENLSYLGKHDHLTGLVNKGLFDDRLQHALARAARHDTKLALLHIDIDDLSAVNEGHGAPTGDELLRAITQRWKGSLRKMDTLARVASDTFMLIAEDIRGEDDALVVARKLLEAIAQPFSVRGGEIRINASVGVALFPDDAGDANRLSWASETALAAAKNEGGGRYGLFADIT